MKFGLQPNPDRFLVQNKIATLKLPKIGIPVRICRNKFFYVRKFQSPLK